MSTVHHGKPRNFSQTVLPSALHHNVPTRCPCTSSMLRLTCVTLWTATPLTGTVSTPLGLPRPSHLRSYGSHTLPGDSLSEDHALHLHEAQVQLCLWLLLWDSVRGEGWGWMCWPGLEWDGAGVALRGVGDRAVVGPPVQG